MWVSLPSCTEARALANCRWRSAISRRLREWRKFTLKFKAGRMAMDGLCKKSSI